MNLYYYVYYELVRSNSSSVALQCYTVTHHIIMSAPTRQMAVGLAPLHDGAVGHQCGERFAVGCSHVVVEDDVLYEYAHLSMHRMHARCRWIGTSIGKLAVR